MTQSALYYTLCSLAAAVFLVGVAGNVGFWLSGSVEGRSLSLGRKLLWLAGRSPGLIWRRRTLGAVLWYGLLQGHLMKENRARWLMSFCLTWGAIDLFFVGSLVDMLTEYGAISVSKDAPWLAALSDGGGLLVLLGLGIALYRRYGQRVPQMRSGWEDAVILGGLGLVVVSGYVLEAARLLAEGSPGGAGYAFVGYGISRLLSPGPGWEEAHRYLWWAHGALAISLVAYMPYSKLFHALATPLAVMARAGGQGPAPRPD